LVTSQYLDNTVFPNNKRVPAKKYPSRCCPQDICKPITKIALISNIQQSFSCIKNFLAFCKDERVLLDKT
jgi:hypothetical protein